MMKKIFYPTVFSIILLTAACQSKKENTTANTEGGEFPVTFPILVDTTYKSDYVAEIQSIQNVEIRPQSEGYLQKIHVDEGKFVRKGQLLFTLSGQLLREELNKAQAAQQTAIAETKTIELEIRNTQLLMDKNIVSSTELDMKKAQLDVLRAKVQEVQAHIKALQTQMSLTEIHAPFDGIVGRIPNKIGSLVNAQTLLTTISDNSSVFAYFNVSESEYLSLTQNKDFMNNQNINLVLANGQMHSQKGKIESIDAQFNQETGNIALRARFANPQQLLKHGASGKVQMTHTLKNALVIPQKSTFDVQDKTFVYCVGDDGIVKTKSIVPKLRLDHIYVVESGVTPSDKIILEGIQNVKEGDKIAVVETPSSKQISQLVR